MTCSLIIEMMLTALAIAGGVGLFFCLFCWFLVRGGYRKDTRLGDIGWKRVDYYWIIIGSLGLILQALQIGADDKAATLAMQQSIGRSTAMNLNRAAADLSDEKVCPPLLEKCKKYQLLRPKDATSTTVDVRIFIHYNVADSSSEEEKNPELIKRLNNFKRTFAADDEQSLIIQQAKALADEHARYMLYLKALSALLLAAAIGLRLAKVRGEILLKADSIKKKSESMVSTQEFDAAIKKLATTSQLNELEKRLLNTEACAWLKYYFAASLLIITLAVAIIIYLLVKLN